MHAEINALEKNNTWILTDFLPPQKVVTDVIGFSKSNIMLMVP